MLPTLQMPFSFRSFSWISRTGTTAVRGKPESKVLDADAALSRRVTHMSVSTHENPRFRLLSCLPECGADDIDDLSSVVERISNDVAETPDTQSLRWGAWYPKVFKRALPFDTCNPDKSGLLLELLPTVGVKPLFIDVWRGLTTYEHLVPGQIQANRMVLLTGTSGMGKTKAAYDIGHRHACVVMMRFCEKSQLTLPWDTAIRFLSRLLLEVFPVTRPTDWSMEERGDSVTCVLLLAIGAHLEYAVDVCDGLIKFRGNCRPTEDVIREVVLRAQRNGLAYRAACNRFTACIQKCLQDASKPPMHAFKSSAAMEYIRSLLTRFRVTCGHDIPVVFVYDEAQAFLDGGLHSLPNNVGEGSFAAASPQAPGDGRPEQGIFYALLAAIRTLIDDGGVRAGHLLLANRWNVDDALRDPLSPAQGVATSIHRAFNLTEKDIYVLLKEVLQDDVYSSLEGNENIALLTGRPLFASQLLQTFVSAIVKQKSDCVDPSSANVQAVAALACKDAADGANEDAITRLEACVASTHTVCGLTATPSVLVRRLMHHVIMHDGEPLLTADLKAEMYTAVARGILNVEKGTTSLDMIHEPATTLAIKELAVRLIRSHSDGIMEYLASSLTHAPTGSAARNVIEEVMHKCIAWYLVRTCIVQPDAKITLAELLGPLLATDVTIHKGPGMGGVDDNCLPECMRADSGWTVHITCGKTGGDRSLTLLAEDGTRLIHHTADELAGPDILFLAKHRSGTSKMVGIHIENRSTGTTLHEVMKSLQPINWKTDPQAVLDEHPEWKHCVRCIAGARSFEPAVLHAACWYNTSGGDLEASPVLCLSATPRALQVDIMGDAAAYCYGPSDIDWPSILWPANVTAEAEYPCCTVEYRAATKQAILDAVTKLDHEPAKRFRVILQDDGTYAATVTYEHFAYAIDAVRKAGAHFAAPPESAEDVN